jgi:mannose-6-phosphate isomerase-like protein (cupin superfamily)
MSASEQGRETGPIPADDPRRQLAVARPDDPGLSHIAMGGNTYTILLSGDDTGGRFTLIDMYVPPGGGPPPHRHDFEETFIVLEGHLDVGYRGTDRLVRAGTTVNVPANAPHQFRNSSGEPARLLCICAPAGQEEFFAAVGDRVPDRTAPPPQLDAAAQAARVEKARQLASLYRTELLLP